MNYAEDLLYKGVVHFRQAAYFLNLQGDGARGDKHDGARIFNTPMVIKDSAGEKTRIGKAYAVRSQEELRTSYIFCTSKSLRADLFSAFNTNCCVTIMDTSEFKKRIFSKASRVKLHLTKQAHLPRIQKTKKINIGISYLSDIMSDDVVYFDDLKTEETMLLSADIKQKFFHKRKSLYEWEDEYRILIEPKGKISLFSSSEEDAEILKSFMKHNSFSDIFPVGINVIIGNIEDIAEMKMVTDV
jgi:energy-converting hydrogenase A subunit M